MSDARFITADDDNDSLPVFTSNCRFVPGPRPAHFGATHTHTNANETPPALLLIRTVGTSALALWRVGEGSVAAAGNNHHGGCDGPILSPV